MAIGATGGYASVVTLAMIGLSLEHIKTRGVYRLMASCADKMFWMPNGIQGRDVAPPNGLGAGFTDKL
jgi:hypothetical protein